jgi:hypothetical protein
MKRIIFISAIVCLTSFVLGGQVMMVNTKSGVKNFSVSSIDSITFTTVKDSAIFDNGNIGGVSGANSPPADSTCFSISAAMVVTYLQDYHYYNGGHLPGTISLKHSDGTVYGPFQTTGLVGQGNVPNAYWVCYPDVTIKAGSYTVIDSDPSTWSHNTESSDKGFARVQGYPAQ